jgi:hypothetical protein
MAKRGIKGFLSQQGKARLYQAEPGEAWHSVSMKWPEIDRNDD